MIWLRMFWVILLAIFAFFLICVICCANFSDDKIDYARRVSMKVRQRAPEVRKILQATIKKFKTHEMKEGHKNPESCDCGECHCIICLEEFKKGNEIAELNCNSKHIFHLTCLIKWL